MPIKNSSASADARPPGRALSATGQPTINDLRATIARYGWYHETEVAPGVTTPGWQVARPVTQKAIDALHKVNVKGKRVLDVGCRDGAIAFEAEKLGAADVIGIDNDISKGATEFLIPHLGSRVKMHEMNLFDLTTQTFGTFDVIVLAGVLYHLRYPFWGLKILRDLLVPNAGILIVETAILIDENRHAMLFCPTGA